MTPIFSVVSFFTMKFGYSKENFQKTNLSHPVLGGNSARVSCRIIFPRIHASARLHLVVDIYNFVVFITLCALEVSI